MDWKMIIEPYKADLLTDLKGLLRIASVKDVSTASEQAPFGQGIKEALHYMLALGERDGFRTYKIPGFITKTASKEGIVSSYKTKNSVKYSAPRPYTTITHMNAAIVDFTQKDIDVILNKAQEIFNQELEK